MYNEWQKDMDLTQPYVEQIRKTIFGGVEFRNIEKSDNELLLWLDQYSGIDYIFKSKKNHIVGVAARIQYDTKLAGHLQYATPGTRGPRRSTASE